MPALQWWVQMSTSRPTNQPTIRAQCVTHLGSSSSLDLIENFFNQSFVAATSCANRCLWVIWAQRNASATATSFVDLHAPKLAVREAILLLVWAENRTAMVYARPTRGQNQFHTRTSAQSPKALTATPTVDPEDLFRLSEVQGLGSATTVVSSRLDARDRPTPTAKLERHLRCRHHTKRCE